MNDLVALAEIAARLGVASQTVYQWRWRRKLPRPDLVVSGRPIWHWSTIEAWARETGRLK